MYTLQRAVRSIHTSIQPPRLTKISLHPPKNVEVEFADGSAFNLSAEFLRVYSPAVDSKIRSVGGEKVIFGRSHVGIMSAEPVGNYGIRIVFDDLHKTGIYTWDYFYHLGSNKFTLMRNYVKTLKKHGLSRDPQRRKTSICFSQQQRLFFSSVKSVESRVDGLRKLKVVPATTLTAQNQEEAVVPEVASTLEKEAVKNVLTLFLRKQGLTNAAATRTISKSDCFINYLVSRLHTIDKTRYLVGTAGSELPILALEIRDAVVPYLESLLEEHGDILVDVVENFSNSPNNKGPIFQASPTKLPLDSKKLEVMDHPTSELRQSGILPPVTLYLLDIGMDVDQIKEVCRKYPSFVDFSLEKQIKRAVEFLLGLGMPQSDIPSFLCKAPHYCGSDPIPTFLYLENLGLDKGQLLKMLKRYPRIFECKRHNVKRIVDFLHELGLSTKDIVKVIGTMYPKVVTYSVDDRLWPPIAEYFHSIGVNVPLLFFRYPMVFRYSVEHNIKPMTEFWLDNGFSMEEIRTMAVNGGFYFLRVKNNLRPKWDFFLTMGYPRSMLVKFPQYFGYSLEQNIKPRYERMMKRGVKLSLTEMLTSNDSDFEKSMNRWLKRNTRNSGGMPRLQPCQQQQQQDCNHANNNNNNNSNKFFPLK